MVSIGKLAPSQERYYLDAVAQGREDYYLGAGEAPGQWIGSAASDLGLSGEVHAHVLALILDGHDPTTDERISQKQRAADRVPGFDVTFSAPKSVSLLHALAAPEVAREVRDAHDQAMRAALGYLESEAALARRRTNGRIERHDTSGFVAAAFRHRTSRAGDPALHTHVLVANLVKGPDGNWGAFDAAQLYAHAKTAGYLYQAHLRWELTRRLGVEWTAMRRGGTADIEGISRDVIRAFSRRRAQIEARMHERGEHSSRAAATATLDTRPSKDHATSTDDLRTEWRERANSLGLDAVALDALTHQRQLHQLGPDEITAHSTEFASPEGLTHNDSTFARRDVIQAWCDHLPTGATVAEIERLASRFITTEHALALGPGRLGEDRFTTAEMLDTEERLINSALSRRDANVGISQAGQIDRAIAGRTLRPEQEAAVRELTTSGHGVDVLIGKAGSGKTYTLGAAREAWQANGQRVIGCSTAARAAAVLQDETGIQSQTIVRLLGGADEAGGLPQGAIVVVDEAGMVGTRTLARLLDLVAEADGKAVLVGDYRQLPEIEAGGALRALADTLGPITLDQNRRQTKPWERDALDHLRHGDVEEALALYEEHDRIVTAPDADSVRDRLVDDWWKAWEDDCSSLMIAARRSDVDDLNQRARERLDEAGQLTGEPLIAAGRAFRVGDHILAARNDRRLGLMNGLRATVTEVDHPGRTLTIMTNDQRNVRVPSRYLDAGHIAHGYASTAHKAQGITAPCAYVLGDDVSYREWAYVGLSRGRTENRLYSVEDAELSVALGRSKAKTLATSVIGRSR